MNGGDYACENSDELCAMCGWDGWGELYGGVCADCLTAAYSDAKGLAFAEEKEDPFAFIKWFVPFERNADLEYVIEAWKYFKWKLELCGGLNLKSHEAACLKEFCLDDLEVWKVWLDGSGR